MTRTGVRTGRVVALGAAVVSLVLLAGRAAGTDVPTARGPAAARQVVRPGDTIWEIARARVGESGDPRPLVEAIRAANGLRTSSLQAGQVLIVPPAP